VARSPKATKYFARDGLMKRFPHLSHYSLATVLKLKNRIKPAEATKFAEFLLPMLVPEP
jgi:hypothetical protein